MRRISVISFVFLLTPTILWGETLDYRSSTRFSPHDYLYGSRGKRRDPIFDQYRSIDLNIDLGIGSDCGRINFHNTLRASLRNLLDAKYFGDMGKNILAASPMLLVCYLSPTWCSILKSLRLKANLLANMRLDQCSLIDKYVDSRVEDFYRERQQCFHRSIRNTGGDMESAMESCKNYWSADVSNWAGDRFGKTSTNKLLESSAKWQGMTDGESKGLVNLLKSFVGDSVVTRGRVSVDYGPRRVKFTPRTYLKSLKQDKYSQLERLLGKIESQGSNESVYSIVSDRDLATLNGEAARGAVDRQTLQSLIFMPYRLRRVAMRKLSDALAMPEFSEKMEQSLDFMTRVTQNVHLPDNRKKEAEQKRQALKEQVEMTLLLDGQKSESLNQILASINREGEKYESVAREHRLNTNSAHRQKENAKARFLDCADDIFCE